MKINEIKDTNFAFNEVTGQLVCFLRDNTFMTVIAGDSGNPEVLCQLLFNSAEIAESWSPMCSKKVMTRLLAYTNCRL